jgi:hypothetical protein
VGTPANTIDGVLHDLVVGVIGIVNELSKDHLMVLVVCNAEQDFNLLLLDITIIRGPEEDTAVEWCEQGLSRRQIGTNRDRVTHRRSFCNNQKIGKYNSFDLWRCGQ